LAESTAAAGLPWRWYSLAAFVLLSDQLSKLAASQWLDYAVPQRLLSWFDLTLHHNPGAAFSFLSGAGGWQRWLFTGLAVVVSLVLLEWLRRLPRARWLLALALALVLGGAVGNLVDRVLHGYVIDFISVHYRDWYFPTFNIADSAISVGAALVILDSLLGEARHEPVIDREGGSHEHRA
jgi:signal peptidase II